MSKKSSPVFLVKNRLGVYYFQRRLTADALTRLSLSSRLVRISLRTKNRSTALSLARTIAVMWDMRAKQFFKSEENYHRGMKLLQEFLAVASRTSSFDEVSRLFLDELDDTTDRESDLLDRAIKLHTSRQLDTGQDPYAKQLSDLASLIDSKFSEARTHQSIKRIDTPKLSQAFESFIASQRGGWKSNSGMETSYREVMFAFLSSIIGDKPTGSITKNDVQEVINILLVYPANKTKKTEYSYLSTRDFLNIDTPEEDRLKPVTKKKYLTQIGTFFRWLKSTDLSSIDLDAPLKNVKVQRTKAADQKSVFTCQDLSKLFNSIDYLQGQHQTASRFWVPLIALYTGARLNEICQLSCNDVRHDAESNRWVFDFNENDDVPHKSLKRSNHNRLVPLHKKLIELGFLDYVKLVSQKNSRIFPELEYAGEANKYGNAIQRWFNRTYLNKKNCNITTEKTSFHSLRHTVITHLAVEHNVQENQIAAGFGQSAKGGVYETRYAKHHAFSAYFKYFDLINFDKCYESKKIRHWKHHIFSRSFK